MRVITYNIAGNRGRSRPAHMEEIAGLVRLAEPDVVGLQEVVHVHGDSRPPEELLAELTGMHAWFLPAHQFKRYCLGNAVLCRQPITRTVSHELPHAWPERRVLLEVETTTQDALPITVFCTHLVHMAGVASPLRLAQAARVARQMSTCWRPHFLMGDLNASPFARELAPLRRLREAPDHLRGLRSWPARRPWVLYDHVWPGPGWVVEAVEVMDLHVSDHRPLLAQLGWKGAPRYPVQPEASYQENGHAAPERSASARLPSDQRAGTG